MLIKKIEHKIEDILYQYPLGSTEHQTLMLHILALQRQLHRDLVTIEHQLEDNKYEWFPEEAA